MKKPARRRRPRSRGTYVAPALGSFCSAQIRAISIQPLPPRRGLRRRSGGPVATPLRPPDKLRSPRTPSLRQQEIPESPVLRQPSTAAGGRVGLGSLDGEREVRTASSTCAQLFVVAGPFHRGSVTIKERSLIS